MSKNNQYLYKPIHIIIFSLLLIVILIMNFNKIIELPINNKYLLFIIFIMIIICYGLLYIYIDNRYKGIKQYYERYKLMEQHHKEMEQRHKEMDQHHKEMEQHHKIDKDEYKYYKNQKM